MRQCHFLVKKFSFFENNEGNVQSSHFARIACENDEVIAKFVKISFHKFGGYLVIFAENGTF